MPRVGAPEALRHQRLDRPAEQLVPLIAEQTLRLRVHQHHAAERVDDDDRVVSELEETPESRLDARRLGEAPDERDVLVAEDDELDALARIADRLGADVDVQRAAVLPPAHGLIRGRAGLDGLLELAARLVLALGGYQQLNHRASDRDRKSTRLNSSHRCISYAVFCLKKKKK